MFLVHLRFNWHQEIHITDCNSHLPQLMNTWIGDTLNHKPQITYLYHAISTKILCCLLFLNISTPIWQQLKLRWLLTFATRCTKPWFWNLPSPLIFIELMQRDSFTLNAKILVTTAYQWHQHHHRIPQCVLLFPKEAEIREWIKKWSGIDNSDRNWCCYCLHLPERIWLFLQYLFNN